jgi:hypothetical protein
MVGISTGMWSGTRRSWNCADHHVAIRRHDVVRDEGSPSARSVIETALRFANRCFGETTKASASV